MYNENMDIKTMLRIEQAKRGSISDAEIARRCGMTPQTYCDMLRRNDLKISTLERVADALGCDLVIEFRDREKE